MLGFCQLFDSQHAHDVHYNYKGFLKTRWHAQVRAILEGYLGDMWRKCGGHLEDLWRKNTGQLEGVKRRLKRKNLVVKNLIFKDPC